MEFAGAQNQIAYVQKDELKIIKGNRVSIGGYLLDKKRSFTTHTIDLKYPTTFYLYTDGYQDQFGGPDGKKFKTTRFRNLLFEVHREKTEDQKNILNTTIEDWMRNTEQVDDILVLGGKL